MLDEPTLGLDILARRSFYDALVNDYMDETRTILITTHQVEEVENLLTDVIFIDQGRIVLDCSLDDIAARYAAVAVADDKIAAARAEQPFYERPHARQNVLYFEQPDFGETRGFRRGARRRAFPTCSSPNCPRSAVMNTYVWLIRREFWENRAIWIVPAVIGVRAHRSPPCSAESTSQHRGPRGSESRDGRATVLFAFGFTFFAVMSIYSTWYLLDCLYADRKDRSVLFWKSLPISDTATVLAKLFTGLIAIPLVYFAAADVSTLLMAFIISMRAHAYLGSALWQPDLWLQLQALWLYVIAHNRPFGTCRSRAGCCWSRHGPSAR